MRHSRIERLANGSSIVHRLDARIKLILLLAFLVTVALVPQTVAATWSLVNPLLWLALLPIAVMLSARLPSGALLLRACVVLPLSGTFGLLLWLNGDSQRAVAVVAKSYISATAALTLAATTRGPDLFRAFEFFKAPRIFVLLLHFTYRYIFVMAAQAIEMRDAARARGMRPRATLSGMQGAAGAIAVLFARSFSQAEAIHRAMLARGFDSRFAPAVERPIR